MEPTTNHSPRIPIPTHAILGMVEATYREAYSNALIEESLGVRAMRDVIFASIDASESASLSADDMIVVIDSAASSLLPASDEWTSDDDAWFVQGVCELAERLRHNVRAM